ncbi:H-NS histone family protein [Curvibacter sp. APW13]|uniref:H-NS histone family protein n=1 Tax=Curvibacter sp. APW13 TaxID=3077236 RepID=UPI0028DDE836|nr:H-NS histone family protein [Curvibacter sp. APW13]MDT8989860.1 H-NS histone family protein [Curvibacter sp. APW13]
MHALTETASAGHVLCWSLDQAPIALCALQHALPNASPSGGRKSLHCYLFRAICFWVCYDLFSILTEILMTNLLDIQSQIEKLQKQANDIRAKEFDATVQDILAKMQAFGITIKDLQTAKPAKGRKSAAKPRTAKAAKPSKRAGVAVAPKYRGPNGETWTGRGLMPKWLSALVAQGQSKESFAISA